MTDHTSFWRADDTDVSPPSGEQIVELLQRSLKDNMFSARGSALAKQHAVQRTRPSANNNGNISGHRRPREEEIDSEEAAPTVLMPTDISSLVRATFIPFSSAAPLTTLQNEILAQSSSTNAPLREQNSSLTETDEKGESAAKKPKTEEDAAEKKTGEDFSVAHLNSIGDSPSTDANWRTNNESTKPKSALAQLVAKAKAHYGTDTHVRESRPVRSDSYESQGLKSSPHECSTQPTKQKDEPRAADEDEDFGVVFPADTRPSAEGSSSEGQQRGVTEKHPSQMTREEFLSQFKRAPRRGEIGQSADEIAAAEQLGYVMSGSRSKASQVYVDRVQRQLHEREAAKLQQQFRKVEDERMDDQILNGMLKLINKKR